MTNTSVLDEYYEIELKCVRVHQPVGDFYIASIDSAHLIEITFSDVREIDRELDNYLGIQREVNKKRVAEIEKYVNTIDACFPTAVILAVEGRCASYDEARGILNLKSDLDPSAGRDQISRIKIAKVLDGQHRIEGLRGLGPENRPFEVNVSIFIDMDVESQAYLFSKVNLAQTKVKKSLVYDLFDYARSRSPQKTCHNIAVALDGAEKSPFYRRIKRLGVSTEGRFGELLTQSTFVEALLPYVSRDPVDDRDLFMRGKRPGKIDADESEELIFRNMFLDERDLDITKIVFNFFSAVQERWPQAWNERGRGYVLNRTNGFRGLVRALRPAYLHVSGVGGVPEKDRFLELLHKVVIEDEHFTSDNYKPGTSGETQIFNDVASGMGVI